MRQFTAPYITYIPVDKRDERERGVLFSLLVRTLEASRQLAPASRTWIIYFLHFLYTIVMINNVSLLGSSFIIQ